MLSAFDIVSITPFPARRAALPCKSLLRGISSFAPTGGFPLALLVSPSVVRAVDEETDDDDDASEPEVVVPPTEPLETTSDFDEDDFDDDFDDDFEEEFEDDEFDSEITPEDLEASDDTEDPFDDN
ncbi:MAG TPA: hypothetical protein VHY91_12550 [Pirellulales bacterium]|jgi:hypothetical protein|nr:hypothetical protein [Pirellulales bacterium]